MFQQSTPSYKNNFEVSQSLLESQQFFCQAFQATKKFQVFQIFIALIVSLNNFNILRSNSRF